MPVERWGDRPLGSQQVEVGPTRNDSMRQVNGVDSFRPEWSDPDDITEWLNRNLPGRTLNICSGKSPVGDIRLDAEATVRPDVVGDVHSLPFVDSAFDSVYVDPPFGLYQSPGGHWPDEVWRVTKERAIFQVKRPTALHFDDAEKWMVPFVPTPGSQGPCGWLFQGYDRRENRTDSVRFRADEGATKKRKARVAATGLLVKEGRATVPEILDESGLGESSRRTVRRALSELVTDGIARKTKEGGHSWFPGPVIRGVRDIGAGDAGLPVKNRGERPENPVPSVD